MPRFTPGEFHFSFGKFRYVDALSLKYQYREIFLCREYDFASEGESPFILDCGGNVGLSVVRFKRRYPKCRVIVFEADPLIAQVLSRNVAELALKEVSVIKAAVWKENGRVGFASDEADSGRIVLRDAPNHVPAIRLADFVTQPIDLLKLDIEGAEYEIVEDLHEAGKIRDIRKLICEVHGRPTDRFRLSNLVNILVENGFYFTIADARSAPDLLGDPEQTPFPFVSDGKFLLHLYAWRAIPQKSVF